VLRGAISSVLVLFLAGYAQVLKAQSAEITPKLSIRYNQNDNIDAIDLDSDVDPTTQAWIDYLLGIEGKAKQVDTEEGLEVSLGYAQYVDSEGDYEDLADISNSKYNYFTIIGGAWFMYTGRNVTLEILDDIVRTRSLEELFGPGTSALSNRYLYTDNIASLQLRFQVSPKSRALLRYSYETTVFDTPENELLEYSKPSDSTGHLGYARMEYDFSPKTTGFIDLQGGQRLFEERLVPAVYDPVTLLPTVTVDVKTADYTYYQGVLGAKYSFNERTSLSVSAGAHTKSFFNEGIFDLEDYTVPAGRITFTQLEQNRYRLDLIGETSSSIYGMDMFFNYYSGIAKFRYYFYRKMSVEVQGSYRQDTFDLEINDREDLWDHDRVDHLLYYGATFNWALLEKNNRIWLGIELFYNHRSRDSNITDQDDYVATYGGFPISYDTSIDYFGAQVQFMPSILIGR
jgi:hypothetical protein